MANTQSHTTCHDHRVNPWSIGQRLFSARLTDIIATQIMDAAIAQPYPDWSAALLQRAADISHDTLIKTNDYSDNQQVMALQLRAYEIAADNFDLIAKHQALLIKPERFDPDPSPVSAHIEPILSGTYDQKPNQYWNWLQAHVDACVIPSSIETLLDDINAPVPDAATMTDILGAICHAVNTSTESVQTRDNLPHDLPPGGLNVEKLNEIRLEAQEQNNVAQEILDDLVPKHFRDLPRDFSPDVAQHPALISAIEARPFAPSHVRTIVTPPSDPHGATMAIVFHTGTSIAARIISEPEPANFPETLYQSHRDLATQHIALDMTNDNTEPAEDILLHIINAILPGANTLLGHNPDTVKTIMHVATQRGVPEDAVRHAINAATSHITPVFNRVMSDAGVTPQHCTTEMFQKIAHSATQHGADPHLVHALAQAMNLPTRLLNLPSAVITEQQTQAVVDQARKEGIREYYITLWKNSAKNASFPGIVPQASFQRHNLIPTDFYPPPQPAGTIAYCSCDFCHRHSLNALNSPRDAHTMAVRHHGDAAGLRAIIRMHQNIDTTDVKRRRLADQFLLAIADITRMLEHHCALNQTHSTQPHHHLYNQILDSIEMAHQHILPEPTSSSPDPRHNAPHSIALIAHAQATHEAHQERIESDDIKPDELIRRIHATRRLIYIVDLANDTISQCPKTECLHAVETLQVDPFFITDTITDEFKVDTEFILSETPTVVSERAAQHELLLEELTYPLDTPFGARFAFTTNHDGQPTLPTLVSRYHQGQIHINTSEEPCPKGYPAAWTAEDKTQLLTAAYSQCHQPPTEDITHHMDSHHSMSMIGMHDIPAQTWPSLIQKARQAGIPKAAIDVIIQTMSGAHLPIHIQSSAPIHDELRTDVAMARSILDSAATAGANPYQIKRLALAMLQPSLAPTIPPIPKRHVRALVKTARERGVPNHVVARMRASLNQE